METPFIFGKIATEKNFTDRELETSNLVQNFTSLINTIIISPRRWGKSSLVNKAAKLARRTFIFSCFCGLAYVDVQRLYPHHIGTTADGRKYIRTYRKKTDVEAFIPLHPIAEQIISLYNTTDNSKPIFPLPCRDMIWFEIHELGFAHQFKHNLSYHQSRHTFGTLLVSAGVPMESIAKMMGHTNIRTTQGYAKVTDDKISEDMDRLIEKRQKQQSITAR